MAQNVNPTFVKTPNFAIAHITTGTGGGVAVTVYTGGVSGSKVSGLLAVSLNTTTAFDVGWGVSTGVAGYGNVMGTVSLPVQAGFVSGVPTVNLFNTANIALPVDSDGNPFLFLPSTGYSIFAIMSATSSTWVTGASVQIIAPSIGDF